MFSPRELKFITLFVPTRSFYIHQVVVQLRLHFLLYICLLNLFGLSFVICRTHFVNIL